MALDRFEETLLALIRAFASRRISQQDHAIARSIAGTIAGVIASRIASSGRARIRLWAGSGIVGSSPARRAVRIAAQIAVRRYPAGRSTRFAAPGHPPSANAPMARNANAPGPNVATAKFGE